MAFTFPGLRLALAAALCLATAASADSLHDATRDGDLTTLQSLVSSGTDLDARNDYGSTPLTIAVTYGQAEAAKLLIDNGAALNLEGSGGSTPLHLATFFGRIALVEMLLEAGADTAAQNGAGLTPLQVAAAPFADDLPTYEAMARALSKRGLVLDLAQIEQDRAKIAEILAARSQ